jgi:hypothetical protein
MGVILLLLLLFFYCQCALPTRNMLPLFYSSALFFNIDLILLSCLSKTRHTRFGWHDFILLLRRNINTSFFFFFFSTFFIIYLASFLTYMRTFSRMKSRREIEKLFFSDDCTDIESDTVKKTQIVMVVKI